MLHVHTPHYASAMIFYCRAYVSAWKQLKEHR